MRKPKKVTWWERVIIFRGEVGFVEDSKSLPLRKPLLPAQGAAVADVVVAVPEVLVLLVLVLLGGPALATVGGGFPLGRDGHAALALGGAVRGLGVRALAAAAGAVAAGQGRGDIAIVDSASGGGGVEFSRPG